MTIKGAFAIVPDAVRNGYRYIMVNTGDVPLVQTHNINGGPNQGGVDSDDYGTFGHGNAVSPGRSSEVFFPAGFNYGGRVSIGPNAYFRGGARYAFTKEFLLPEITQNAEPVIIRFDSENPDPDIQWVWSGDRNILEGAARHVVGYYRPCNEIDKMTAVDALAELEALISGGSAARKVSGFAEVIPQFNENGAITSWDIAFENNGNPNDGFVPFNGTVVFSGHPKNAGLGLESMPCPEQNSRAVQRIVTGGNYGATAGFGQIIRLGVRGLSSIELPLPAVATRINLNDFTVDSNSSDDSFFDADDLANKREEKADVVQFFVNGQPYVASEEGPTFRGAEAVSNSDYAVPSLSVSYSNNMWSITLQNPFADSFAADFPRAIPPNVAGAEHLGGTALAGAPISFRARLRNQAGEEIATFIESRITNEQVSWQLDSTKFSAEDVVNIEIVGTGLFFETPLRPVQIDAQQPEGLLYRPRKVAHHRLVSWMPFD